MSVLEKAVLQEIESDESAAPVGDPVPVQFNPTTLKLNLSNKVEGGKSRGRQARQYTGKSSTSLSVELVFDTADEGITDRPRSVRERTGIVEKFVLPKEGGKEAPPKLRFQWGSFIIDGVVESIDIEFDHFASNGTPLRAKVSLTLKEQDAKYQFLQAGPGANQTGQAPDSGTPGDNGPGSTSRNGDRTAPALAGETGPEFASRMGLDPAAWRGLDVDLSAGLTLEAGIEVGFRAELNVSAGIGVTVGVSAGLKASVEASLGLEAGGSATAAGFKLASAGGVSAALQTAHIARVEKAESMARQAFPAPATPQRSDASASASAVVSADSHPRLNKTGLPSASQQAATPSASPPPRVDPRAATFGFGVPLRTSVRDAAVQRKQVVLGPGSTSAAAAPEFRQNPSTPPWVQLPVQDAGRKAADATQSERAPAGCCGCCGSPGAN